MKDDGRDWFSASAMPDREWWAALWPHPEDIVRKLGVEPGMRVVDLCCGDGYFTAALARIVGRAVVGIDIDAGLLELARAEVERSEAPTCIWIVGDAREISSLVREETDYVFLANTFHGAPDKTTLSREVAAALKSSGLFGIVNWHRKPREETVVHGHPRGPRTELRMTPEATMRAVEPAGFELVRFVELPPYHYGAIFTRSVGSAA